MTRESVPLQRRYPRGRSVRVYDDFHDYRYRGLYGSVVRVLTVPSAVYPDGRVAVRIEAPSDWQELMACSCAPRVVWFRPQDLEKV